MAARHPRRKHGDPFPLNSAMMFERAADSGCFEPQRAQWVGEALNKLALQEKNSNNSPHFASERQPTAVQDFVFQRVVDSLLQYGEKPDGLGPESALRDMQAAEISYDGMPNNLASYDPGMLKVLRSQVQPKRITKFLPVEPAKLVEHYDDSTDANFSPYWDPALRCLTSF